MYVKSVRHNASSQVVHVLPSGDNMEQSRKCCSSFLKCLEIIKYGETKTEHENGGESESSKRSGLTLNLEREMRGRVEKIEKIL